MRPAFEPHADLQFDRMRLRDNYACHDDSRQDLNCGVLGTTQGSAESTNARSLEEGTPLHARVVLKQRKNELENNN